MLAEERRQEILATLHKNDSVHVKQLSKKLNVTEETIRRDLKLLDKKKLLKRTHGGAIPVDDERELSFYIRREKNIEEKDIIAEKAIKFIEPGNTIFLDASTTSLFLAKKISSLNDLTVITNSIRIVMELAESNNINIISTGGILRHNSLSFVGPLANQALQKYFADVFFASCKGISAQHGATDSNELEIEIKQNMAKQAKKIIILADYTKINNIGLTQFVSIDEIDTIITDNKINKSVKEKFNETHSILM